MSSKNNEVFAQLDSGDPLDSACIHAWKKTQNALNSLSACLKSVVGFENVAVALCLRNGSRFDIYSVTDELVVSRASKQSTSRATNMNPHQNICSKGLYDSNKAIRNRSTLSVDVLYGLSTKDFRAFFTAVRRSLGLVSFTWPEKARRRFMDVSDDPIPSGPGRAHSGRDTLILMLRICAEIETAWCECIQRELSSLMKKGRFSESVVSEGNVIDLDISETIEHKECITQPECRSKSHGISRNRMTKSNTKEDGELSVSLELAESLPSDSMMVAVIRKNWVPLNSLMEMVFYPRTLGNCEWYIQRTPADGNCFFSAVMTAANVRGLLPTSLKSVASMRTTLKQYLKQLSEAGTGNSLFRRDWLASCIHDVEDQQLRSVCSRLLETSIRSCSEAEIEHFLMPLRKFVFNWSNMVGNSHWGGLLRVELSILATMTGSAIEVLRKIRCGTSDRTFSSPVGHNQVEVCDTRIGGALVTCERVDLVFPIRSQLPSMRNTFLVSCDVGAIRGGWIGPYPVLRVVLNENHYSACTSKHSYPISPHIDTSSSKPWSEWFNFSDTLVEPFAVLNSAEKVYHKKATTLIEDWREASLISADSARHADTLIMNSKSAELSVSMLSRLDIPHCVRSLDERYMLNDEVITSYMHLLEKRSEKLSSESVGLGIDGPPKCRYMDTWFYRTIDRGLEGPSSKRKRTDLSPFSMIILPALVESHWLLAVCYLQDRIISVYDPLHCKRDDVFRIVRRWVQAQISSNDGREWVFREVRESRGCVQLGSIDCGVYICKAAESLGLGIPIRMSQWDLSIVRKRMIVELFRQEVTTINWPRH